MNTLRKAALKRNAARERAYAARVHVWRNRTTGDCYVVDVETERAFGPLEPKEARARWLEARSCWIDEFLDVHWNFESLEHGPLPGHARDWDAVPESELH